MSVHKVLSVLVCMHIAFTQLMREATPTTAIGDAGVGMGWSVEGPGCAVSRRLCVHS